MNVVESVYNILIKKLLVARLVFRFMVYNWNLFPIVLDNRYSLRITLSGIQNVGFHAKIKSISSYKRVFSTHLSIICKRLWNVTFGNTAAMKPCSCMFLLERSKQNYR